MQVHLNVHVFQLNEEGAADDDETEDNVSIYREWLLPSREFHNLWESLLYEEDIKARLLHYASTVGHCQYFHRTQCCPAQSFTPGSITEVCHSGFAVW